MVTIGSSMWYGMVTYFFQWFANGMWLVITKSLQHMTVTLGLNMDVAIQ